MDIRQEELVNKCKLGDAAAYTALYNQHAAAVYNSILRLVEHTGEAEDVLQESFVAAFNGIGGFQNTGGFRAWVKRIAINKSIDLIRKRKLRFVELEPVWMQEDGETREAVDENEFDEAGFEFKMEAVADAITALPESYRTIFNLYVLEDIPHTEIAQMLGLENGTVRTQYHRAKHKILETLKKGGYYGKRTGEIY